jgi:sugar O-acyltransferase (sialic acid O-acetyltransferase NeuD family)
MKLICLGASNPETIRVVNAIKKVDKDFQFLGFIDNDKKKWGKKFYGYPIFGGVEKVKELTKKYGAFFCNLITRDCVTRYETTRELVKNGAKLVNLVHPSVNLEMVKMGVGNYIQENVILQAEVSIGNNSSIHMGSLIGHETKIGNSVFIAHGCNLSGKIIIEDGVFIGTGVSILPRLTIGRWSIIGAGAVIIENVPPYSVVVGIPGKVIKSVEKKYISGDVF